MSDKAKEKMKLCADGLMELYENEKILHINATLLGLHQLASEALAALEPCRKNLKHIDCEGCVHISEPCMPDINGYCASKRKTCQECGGSGEVEELDETAGCPCCHPVYIKKPCSSCHPPPELKISLVERKNGEDKVLAKGEPKPESGEFVDISKAFNRLIQREFVKFINNSGGFRRETVFAKHIEEICYGFSKEATGCIKQLEAENRRLTKRLDELVMLNSDFADDIFAARAEKRQLLDQIEQLTEQIEKYEVVIKKCIKAMEGSNCLEWQWLTETLKAKKEE